MATLHSSATSTTPSRNCNGCVTLLDTMSCTLQVPVEELPPCDIPQPTISPATPPSRGHLSPSNTIITLSNALTQILLPDPMHPILSSNAIMWNFPFDEMKSSYYSFRSLSTRPNESFNALSQARMLVPLNSDYNAHFHFYPSPPITGRRNSRMSLEQGILLCPNFYDLKLRILTHNTDTLEFIVYTGYITKEFLEKFHNPFKAPLDDNDAAVLGLKIEYTRVPIWPILGLRQRLEPKE
ncbi:uncharacterized protein B0J16DRAFT_359212 [Fusarium flagelliforme]|uniref:uncharacterized protein n=1 Tax=Fusarium flagelliforme TaxID=2675880 RepID=UPI001E8E0208|nr:uncharacterized protein B0J16DRAFT_359212 [Fusarium flagelliforme]KAH7169621.1 hypothetical protein B0J16DRAFT_359212 [Fusarium flagelliforme]